MKRIIIKNVHTVSKIRIINEERAFSMGQLPYMIPIQQMKEMYCKQHINEIEIRSTVDKFKFCALFIWVVF